MNRTALQELLDISIVVYCQSGVVFGGIGSDSRHYVIVKFYEWLGTPLHALCVSRVSAYALALRLPASDKLVYFPILR